jgi:hypothetical protein
MRKSSLERGRRNQHGIRQRALTLVGGGYNASVVVNEQVELQLDPTEPTGAGATASTKQAMNAHERSAVAVTSRTDADQTTTTGTERSERSLQPDKKAATAVNDGIDLVTFEPDQCCYPQNNYDYVLTHVQTTLTISVFDMLRQLHAMWLDYLCNIFRDAVATLA